MVVAIWYLPFNVLIYDTTSAQKGKMNFNQILRLGAVWSKAIAFDIR